VTGGRQLQLAWANDKGRDYLRVSGWSEVELRELRVLSDVDLSLSLIVLPSELAEAGAHIRALQPIAGRFEIDRNDVCFVPRFPFLDGVNYSLLCGSAPAEPHSVGSLEIWTFQRPAPDDPPTTEVVGIYPSADQLPVNQLKLYIHFSHSMSEGWAGRAVHVRRADNDQPLDGVFLKKGPELWDPERRRLTLLFDPGRIKRGLVPHEESGYPLIEGVPVIVSIDTTYRDDAGRQMRTGAERQYKIGPPVRARVNPADWRYHLPNAGSKDPLIVEFDRPLDHALLEHSIWIKDAASATLPGRVSVGRGEGYWQFEPQSPWKEGRHHVIIEPRLEDLSGNSLIRVFDRNLMRVEDAPTEARLTTIDFTCAQPSA
jgi:hypothetical protein